MVSRANVCFHKNQLSLRGFELFAACTSDNVNEQRVAAVQPTENKRTRKVSRGFRRQAMADRTNSSDLEIY